MCKSDDSGAYVALHLDGTFAGSLFLIDDDPPAAPALQPIESFYDAVIEAGRARRPLEISPLVPFGEDVPREDPAFDDLSRGANAHPHLEAP